MISDSESISNSQKKLVNISLTIIFIILISVTIIIRIRTLDAPLERDEGEYAYAGQLMLEGVPPYSLAYNMKMPGIYAAYALILAVFGQTQSGIHAGVLVINTATILLLFIMTKKLFGSIAGVASAVFFAITSISNTIEATANAENFVVLPAIAGIILLMKFIDSKRYLFLIIGGVLLGIAFMMKQHGIGFILFGIFFLLWKQFCQKPLNWKASISVILIYSFSVAFPFLITCLILWYCGVFENFWFWTFEYASHYVRVMTLDVAFLALKGTLKLIIPSAVFIWLAALFGLLCIIWDKNIRRHSAFLIGFTICSFLAVCPGFYFRPHYFVLFLPALSISAAVAVVAIQKLIDYIVKSTAKTSYIAIIVVIVIWLQSFYSQRGYLKQSDPFIVSRYNFGACPFPEAVKIADFIKNHSKPDDKIAILGSEPEIFFYSHRRSATSYIYTYPLMEPQPYAEDMQRRMINQIEAENPRFIILVLCYDSWLIGPKSKLMILNWAQSYVNANYKQIGLVDIYDYESLYFWDSTSKPRKQTQWIRIFERNNY